MSHKADKAIAIFNSGFNCAQSVLTAFADEFGLPHDQAYRISAGFGAGIGRTGKTCGAATGAVMVIGLKYGATNGADLATKDRCHEKIREFLVAFEKRVGSLNCRDLVGVDLSIAEVRKKAHDDGVFATVCAGAVKAAVEIVERMVGKDGPRRRGHAE